MKTRVHAIAGGLALLTIITFWVSTVVAEIFASYETIALVKGLILKGMFVLIPAMMIVGGSGMSLGAKRQDATTLRKKRRMPIIALTGLLVLLPAAFYLEAKASAGAFGTWFYLVQLVELIAGGSNISLMALNIRDGLTMTGKIGNKPVSAASLKVQPNGPLLLSGNADVTDSHSRPLECKKITALCRCGASKNKPYCDGTHNAISFNDAVSDSRTADRVAVYEGKDIAVHYNKLVCSHAAVCAAMLPTVFDSSRNPWINPDNGDVEAIKRVVKACPSGALRYAESNGKPQHLMSGTCGIKIEENGPYRVTAVALIDGAWADGACREKYALCRCGASKNKPYCDGSHVDIGWDAGDLQHI